MTTGSFKIVFLRRNSGFEWRLLDRVGSGLIDSGWQKNKQLAALEANQARAEAGERFRPVSSLLGSLSGTVRR